MTEHSRSAKTPPRSPKGSPTNEGDLVELPDGTKVGMRRKSSSRGKTIDVFGVGRTHRKVHVK